MQPDESDTGRREWSIIGLAARGPYPDLEGKLALFGQFIGDWDIIEARYPQPNGTVIIRSGEVHFGWIMEGRAIQDVWMMHDQNSRRAIPIGTTIRFYDPDIDAWRSTWISPVQGVVQPFIARIVENDIVLEGKSKNDRPEKWIFSHITPNSFRWHSEETHDDGRTWTLSEEMRIQRRDAGAREKN